MNWEAAGAIGETIGAIAVVASLVFVGFHLRQNTRAIRLSSTAEVTTHLEDRLHAIASDEATAALVLRGKPDPESLDSFEYFRFTLICQATYFYLAKAHYQYRSGALDEGTWQAVNGQIANFMNSPGMTNYWENHGSNFPREFQHYVNNAIMVGADHGWSLAGPGMATPGEKGF